MERQHLKLMDSIAAIVGALDTRDLLQSVVSETARHHIGFGAQSAHFAAFGQALIWGLEQQFGAAFTPELRTAWRTRVDAVQDEMIRVAAKGPWTWDCYVLFCPYTAFGSNARSASRNSRVTAPALPSGTAR